MILADATRTADGRRSTGSLPFQQADFEGILEAMDGLPVTIRLLDPPLHEFLPDLEELLGRRPTSGCGRAAIKAALREVNPMLGTRGCRLGHPEPGALRDAGAGDRARPRSRSRPAATRRSRS